jgi:hypothetical protein
MNKFIKIFLSVSVMSVITISCSNPQKDTNFEEVPVAGRFVLPNCNTAYQDCESIYNNFYDDLENRAGDEIKKCVSINRVEHNFIVNKSCLNNRKVIQLCENNTCIYRLKND